jgi:hypothetical protein
MNRQDQNQPHTPRHVTINETTPAAREYMAAYGLTEGEDMAGFVLDQRTLGRDNSPEAALMRIVLTEHERAMETLRDIAEAENMSVIDVFQACMIGLGRAMGQIGAAGAASDRPHTPEKFARMERLTLSLVEAAGRAAAANAKVTFRETATVAINRDLNRDL